MRKLFISLAMLLCAFAAKADQWIRINQLGYLPESIKVAVLISEEPAKISKFDIVDAKSGKRVKTFDKVSATGKYGTMQSTFRLDFSDFEKSGEYYLQAGSTKSPVFPIIVKK